MVNIYSTSNHGIPIGRVADYNNTNPSLAVTSFRILTGTPAQETPINKNTHDFTYAFYGNGPYNLNHPNQTSETLAQNIDYIV